MLPLLVNPDPPPPQLVHALDLAGYAWKALGSVADPDPGLSGGRWAGAVVVAGTDPESALAVCRALRQRDVPVSPLLLVVGVTQLAAAEGFGELWDDFCLTPLQPVELEARLGRLLRPAGGDRPEIVEHGELVLNLETYQAAIAGRPLDLTYMEYELLKFLATHTGKVFTREALLSQVWGYEYYGGARTVDVHVRRLRAKLGEEHAGLISTVRSVGYRFGQSRWGSAP